MKKKNNSLIREFLAIKEIRSCSRFITTATATTELPSLFYFNSCCPGNHLTPGIFRTEALQVWSICVRMRIGLTPALGMRGHLERRLVSKMCDLHHFYLTNDNRHIITRACTDPGYALIMFILGENDSLCQLRHTAGELSLLTGPKVLINFL